MNKKQFKEYYIITVIAPFVILTIALDWLSQVFWDWSQWVENLAKKVNNKINPEK